VDKHSKSLLEAKEEELSRIKDAFVNNENNRLHGKTILDIGTDCAKPLYIALKFEPDKIIGIDENLPSIASDIILKSRLLTKTKIGFYNCSFFDEESLRKIREKEETESFDLILVSKTLHHLRTAKCVLKERGEEHDCLETEKCCIYGFEEQVIFEKLLKLGKRVIVYETFFPQEEDNDKVRGRGILHTERVGENTHICFRQIQG
jgi:SAM-dependent methyltransferase